MCGIFGIWQMNGASIQTQMVQRATASLRHRGPDDEGYLLINTDYNSQMPCGGFDTVPGLNLPPIENFFGQAFNLALGFRRLAILDLSPAGHQPMLSPDGRFSIVFNGEIYNFRELRDFLKKQEGEALCTKTDTEIIIRLYKEFGPKCVHHLRGMFAFAIWDRHKKEMFLARDRLGIKPLYYMTNSSSFLFASEIKALLTSGFVQPQIDLIALDHYLTFGFVPIPYTMLKGIHALPPAHAVHVCDQKPNIYQYWNLPREETTSKSKEDVTYQVRELLAESTGLHQVSDVPIGAFLSGGIDSTGIVGLMSQHIKQPVRTFSVGFHNVPQRFNELNHAKMTSKRFETEHTEAVIDAKDVLNELDNIIWFLDLPSADAVNSYFVSRAAKQGGLTVALSGLGGDEVFGGYGTYNLLPRWGSLVNHTWGKIPFGIRHLVSRVLANMASTKPTGSRWHKLSKLKHVTSPLDLYGLARVLLWPDERYILYNTNIREELGAAGDTIGFLKNYTQPNESIWQMVTRLEINNYMGHRLLRDTDAMSMAHSLEVRVPLIDHKLVEFVTSLPSSYKKSGQPKQLLISAFGELLPSEVINRKKHGFEFPLGHWMKHSLKPIVDYALSKQCIERRGLFNYDIINALYQDFKEQNIPYMIIWQFVVLELWMQKYFD